MNTSDFQIKVKRMHKLNNGKGLKAFVDITVNDSLLIRGLKIIEGRNGMFVSMPSEKSKDDKWFEQVRFLDRDAREQAKKEILSAYRESDDTVTADAQS